MFSYIISLSRQRIQNLVNPEFPITYAKWGIYVILSDPHVTLIENSDRIALKLKFSLTKSNSPMLSTDLVVDGHVRYNRDLGELYVQQPQVNIANQLRFTKTIRKIAEHLIQHYLAKYLHNNPIYKLDKTGFKHSFAKTILKSVKVEDGRLIAKLGI